jgi:hypothetical protein
MVVYVQEPHFSLLAYASDAVNHRYAIVTMDRWRRPEAMIKGEIRRTVAAKIGQHRRGAYRAKG